MIRAGLNLLINTVNNTAISEVWLPDDATYNGRLLGLGNGGWASVHDLSVRLLES